MADELPELVVADAAAWSAWLGDRHAASPGVWLVLAKKGGSAPTHMNSLEPTSIWSSPCELWKCGMLCSAIPKKSCLRCSEVAATIANGNGD